MLSRKGDVEVGMPGGCKLGARPIDQHIKGFEALGANVKVEKGTIYAKTKKQLKGAPVYMDVVSVGATINVMLAAVLAKGTTIIDNAAKEPIKQSTSYEFHTMSDVINVLFAITELTDFSFELTNTKPPESPEWTAGIKVNGKGNGKYDADFCLFMENWITKKNMLQTGKISKEKFDSWKSDMLAYYKDSRLDNEAD